MIREMLVGTAVLGGGGYYMVSDQFGADIVRTVNASPQESWRAFDAILNQRREELGDFGMSTPADPRISWPVVTSVPGREIDYVVKRDGVEAIHLKLNFEPMDGGKKTNLSIKVDINRDAMPKGSPGSFADVALFRVGLGKVADEFIKQIENGKIVQFANAISEMRNQIRANPGYGEAKMRMQEYDRREAQAAAAKPQIDPNAARMNPQGAAVVPMNPNPGN
ncbi:MAG: hypothetical protein V4808_04930 [Pseudomonadota bacterium]